MMEPDGPEERRAHADEQFESDFERIFSQEQREEESRDSIQDDLSTNDQE